MSKTYFNIYRGVLIVTYTFIIVVWTKGSETPFEQLVSENWRKWCAVDQAIVKVIYFSDTNIFTRTFVCGKNKNKQSVTFLYGIAL